MEAGQGLLTAEAPGELGLALKRESEFLFMELKSELHEHANTHSSKQIGFILKRKKVQSSQTRY